MSMDKAIAIKIDEEKLSTGLVLDLMEFQAQLSGDAPHRALRDMIALLQSVVVEIDYGGARLEELTQLPFRRLQAAISQIMATVNQTDPN